MVTAEQLQEYLATDKDVTATLAEAEALIAKRIGAAVVPDAVLDNCTLRVAQNLWNLDNSPTGAVNQQFASNDGIGVTGVRVPRNPLASVEHIIRRWVSVW